MTKRLPILNHRLTTSFDCSKARRKTKRLNRFDSSMVENKARNELLPTKRSIPFESSSEVLVVHILLDQHLRVRDRKLAFELDFSRELSSPSLAKHSNDS